MKYYFAIFLLVISFAAQSTEETKKAKLLELVNVTDMDSMMDAMYAQMELNMQNMSTQMGVQPSEQAIFDEYYSKMIIVMREAMSWKKMEPLVIDLYSKNFTEKEITDMLNFYKTESGQSVLKKMPVLMGESMEMGQNMMQDAIPKIQAVAQELAADLEESRKAKVKAKEE